MSEVKHLPPASTATRGSALAVALVGAVAVLVGVGGAAAAVELRAGTAPVQAAPAQVQVAQAGTAARTDGFDPATCLRPAPPAAAPDGGETIGQTVVSFTVPPTTRVTVDAQGGPVAVATNTGQAPCITDAFVATGPDGTAAPANDELRASVLRLHLGDDWSPGVPRLVSSS